MQAPETWGIKKQALLMFSAIQYAFLFGMIFLPYASDVLAVVLPVSVWRHTSVLMLDGFNQSVVSPLNDNHVFHSVWVFRRRSAAHRSWWDDVSVSQTLSASFTICHYSMINHGWKQQCVEMIWNDACSCVCDDTETPAALLYQTNTQHLASNINIIITS